MKWKLMLIAAAAGAVTVALRAQNHRAEVEAALWADATDRVAPNGS